MSTTDPPPLCCPYVENAAVREACYRAMVERARPVPDAPPAPIDFYEADERNITAIMDRVAPLNQQQPGDGWKG